jgi:hypothetical protein
MAENQAELPVRTMCKTLHVSASGYYGWQVRPVCQRQQVNMAQYRVNGENPRGVCRQ